MVMIRHVRSYSTPPFRLITISRSSVISSIASRDIPHVPPTTPQQTVNKTYAINRRTATCISP